MIGDRYILGELFKQGAQAKIWKALDKITGARRIIKTGSGVKQEALLSRRLVHPLIGYAYDCGLDPEHGDYSVYPEFLGKNALEWIGDQGNGTLKQFALKASEFLCFLHHRGWLYNDFKPEHFLMTENGLKVIDLGLCTPLKDGSVSGTFSGTFPYISPERLNGRSFDQRSDIFAFGILLLHLLLPDEEFPSEPSLEALNTLLYKVNKLKEPWKNLVGQMTALEPTQRISSAQELSKRLLSRNLKVLPRQESFGNFPFPVEVLKENMIFMHSNSERIVETGYNQLLIACWEQHQRVYHFDLRSIAPEESFRKLCIALTGQRTDDSMLVFSVLSARKNPDPIVIVYQRPEVLTAEQRSMLFFGISCLAELKWVKIILLSTKTKVPSMGHSWKKFAIPLTADQDSQSIALESVSPAGKKVLNAIALAGGSLMRSSFRSFQDSNVIPKLQEQGFISVQDGYLILCASLDLILSRLRPNQKRSMAKTLLDQASEKIDNTALYHLALHAGDKQLASQIALCKADSLDDSNRMQWFWRAHNCGGLLSRSDLFELAKHKLLCGNACESRPLLKEITKRFGSSFQFANLLLQYFHLQFKLKPAIRTAQRFANIAIKRNNKYFEQYFLLRKAGFLILAHEFLDARRILDHLQGCEGRLAGLRHHYYGLLYYYEGILSDSLKEFQKAWSHPHRFRGMSAMNIGIVHGRMGKFKRAKRWLEYSARSFSKAHDAIQLSHAFNNLGMLHLTSSQMELARKNSIRAFHLSRACRNPHMLLLALNNIGVTYEREGRIDLAFKIRTRVYNMALRFKLPSHQSFALTNAGLHLAFMGRSREAIGLLKRAISLRTRLKLRAPLAKAYEYMGITYLLSQRFKSAEKSFQKAAKLFLEVESQFDLKRINIFCSLIELYRKDFSAAGKLLESIEDPDPDTFEFGLLQYSKAIHQVSSKSHECLTAIHNAERIFRRLPSLFWLAKVHKLKAEYYEQMENFEKSILSLQAAYHLFSRLRAHRELQSLPKEGRNMKIHQEFFDRLAERLPYKALERIKEILSVGELDEMIGKILETALEMTGMDRAMLILNENPHRIFRSASIEDASVSDILDVSRSVLESTTNSGKTVVSLDASSDPLLSNRPSILHNHILSVVCLPLRSASSQIVGCLYLDSKEGVETLAGTEKVMLEIFSSIIGLALNQSLLLERSIQENRKLRDWLELRKECPEMIGNSRAMSDVLQKVHRVLNNNLPVLITGETGTGKELVARILHYAGARKKGPFVAVNCAAFSRDLLESELFGHERGSFTGALQLKKGVFEQAQNGTLLLDEIGEMPPEMQAKLLRVLQGGEFRRIGGTETLSSNARVIFSTNRNLEEMVVQLKFRQDLLFRIQVIEIELPPLRNRPEDIPLLAMSFLKQTMLLCDKRFLGFTPEALDALKRFLWPGNVRQLKSEIEKAATLGEHDWIDITDLDPRIIQRSTGREQTARQVNGSLSEIEKEIIVARLNEYSWNVASTAASLGITRHGLYSKMKRYCISTPEKM